MVYYYLKLGQFCKIDCKVKVYIFCNPTVFKNQLIQIYKDAVAFYGKGSVVMSDVITKVEFHQDWQNMSSEDIRSPLKFKTFVMKKILDISYVVVLVILLVVLFLPEQKFPVEILFFVSAILLTVISLVSMIVSKFAFWSKFILVAFTSTCIVLLAQWYIVNWFLLFGFLGYQVSLIKSCVWRKPFTDKEY